MIIDNKTNSSDLKSKLKPIIELVYRTSLIDRAQCNICTYYMENEQELKKLFNLLKPIVKKNKKERLIQCMICNTVYTPPEFTKEMNTNNNISSPQSCIKCKSEFIVEYTKPSK